MINPETRFRQNFGGGVTCDFMDIFADKGCFVVPLGSTGKNYCWAGSHDKLQSFSQLLVFLLCLFAIGNIKINADDALGISLAIFD